jgi:hypothetical protein
MAVFPQEAFDAFFEENDTGPYRGRDDLSGLQPTLQEQLRFLQETFNEALRNVKLDIPGHVDHPPFYVDYVDSDVQNAIAFRYRGYSLIGITVPLIYSISDACLLLSQSTTVARLLGVRLSVEDYNEVHALLFSMLIAFVMAHEYTHHVHGHVSEDPAAIFLNEILDTSSNGNLKQQIEEIAADGYSLYHVLANFIKGNTQPDVVTLLALDAEQTGSRDEIIFSMIVLAIGAYLFLRPPPKLDAIVVYKLTHPPQVARMNFIMHEAMGWCRQNRPELEAWMTLSRFQDLMSATAEAILGEYGDQVWRDQTSFLKSFDGATYISAVVTGIDAYRQAL